LHTSQAASSSGSNPPVAAPSWAPAGGELKQEVPAPQIPPSTFQERKEAYRKRIEEQHSTQEPVVCLTSLSCFLAWLPNPIDFGPNFSISIL
jgi:hypothetical protein